MGIAVIARICRTRTAVACALAAGMLVACTHPPTAQQVIAPMAVPLAAAPVAPQQVQSTKVLPTPPAAVAEAAPAAKPEAPVTDEDQAGMDAYSGDGLLPPVLRPYGGALDGRRLQRRLPEGLAAAAQEQWRDSDQRGMASWYGGRFHGRKTASGERFDQGDLTAAHRTLPFGSLVCVRSTVTGKTVVVRINDRGPYGEGRVIDLSQGAAQELGMLGLGIKPVEMWTLSDGQDECPAFVAAHHRKNHTAASVQARKKSVVPAKHTAKRHSRKRR